tara:strand:- start:3075 stop:3545 length:471 start_codon:yes stop_codon:yes gene_type:complete
MPLTINNVTINNRLTIINDAAVNETNPNNGPKEYSGDTEADVIIDGISYLNLNASDLIPDNIHALQFSPSTNSGWIEFDGSVDNQSITSSEIPAWANTMITRWNGEKTYWETYQTSFDNAVANLDANSATYSSDYANAQTSAQTSATTAKNNILGA